MDDHKTVRAFFGFGTPIDGFETSSLIWSTGGEANWFNQSQVMHEGTDTVQSGVIDDNQVSWIETHVNGPGTLSFWWKVSSHRDHLRFLINGENQTAIVGEEDWNQQVVKLETGEHSLRWNFFTKEYSGVDRVRAGWLNQVQFVGALITRQPLGTTLTEGESYTFLSSVNGFEPLTYQWLFNGQAIDGATQTSYTISQTQALDAGIYSLVISGSTGSITSRPAVLTVKPLPAKVSKTSKSIGFGDVIVGESSSSLITLLNTGSVNLNISAVTSSLGTSLQVDQAVFTVTPGSSHLLTATVTPVDHGTIDGTLTLTANTASSRIRIPITGYALPRHASMPTEIGPGQFSADSDWIEQSEVTLDGVSAGRSREITHNEESVIQVTVTGPGVLSFWWKVSSEDNKDYLSFRIDSQHQNSISGNVDWVRKRFPILAGNHDLKWTFAKDSWDAPHDGSNTAWLDEVRFDFGYLLDLEMDNGTVIANPPGPRHAPGQIVQLIATPSPGKQFLGWAGDALGQENPIGLVMSSNKAVRAFFGTPIDGFETSSLIWSTGGEANWFNQSQVMHEGTDTVQSGVIDDNQVSWVESQVTGPGILSFWWKVSSESSDVLSLEIEGVQKKRISGEVDWQQESFEIEPGTHVLRWRYAKDGSVDSGSDAAWLSQVQFAGAVITKQPIDHTILGGEPVTFSVSATGVGQLTYQWLFDGEVISGATQSTYTIPQTQTQDEGTYSVEIGSSSGSLRSSPAVLTVLAQASTSLSALAFGDVTVGTGATRSLTLSNTGSVNLNITSVTSSLGSVLQADQVVFTVTPGSSHNITLTFNPVGFGQITGTLTLVSNTADSPIEIPITGNALASGTPNSHPTISGLSDQVMEEDGTLDSLTFLVNDLETDLRGVSVIASSSNPQLIPGLNITLEGTGAIRTITLSPTPDSTGVTTINLQVTDSGALEAETSFRVTVLQVEDSPQINGLSSVAIAENTAIGPVLFHVSDAETEASSLLVNAHSSNKLLLPDAAITIGGSEESRTLLIAPASDQSGTTTVTVEVTDQAGNTESQSFEVFVRPLGIRQPLSGRVYYDLDHDSNIQELENHNYGLGGQKVYLDFNNNGVWDESESFQITDVEGFYSFSALGGGRYRIRLVQPDAFWRVVSPRLGFYSVHLPENGQASDLDFGCIRVATVGEMGFEPIIFHKDHSFDALSTPDGSLFDSPKEFAAADFRFNNRGELAFAVDGKRIFFWDRDRKLRQIEVDSGFSVEGWSFSEQGWVVYRWNGGVNLMDSHGNILPVATPQMMGPSSFLYFYGRPLINSMGEVAFSSIRENRGIFDRPKQVWKFDPASSKLTLVFPPQNIDTDRFYEYSLGEDGSIVTFGDLRKYGPESGFTFGAFQSHQRAEGYSHILASGIKRKHECWSGIFFTTHFTEKFKLTSSQSYNLEFNAANQALFVGEETLYPRGFDFCSTVHDTFPSRIEGLWVVDKLQNLTNVLREGDIIPWKENSITYETRNSNNDSEFLIGSMGINTRSDIFISMNHHVDGSPTLRGLLRFDGPIEAASSSDVPATRYIKSEPKLLATAGALPDVTGEFTIAGKFYEPAQPSSWEKMSDFNNLGEFAFIAGRNENIRSSSGSRVANPFGLWVSQARNDLHKALFMDDFLETTPGRYIRPTVREVLINDRNELLVRARTLNNMDTGKPKFGLFVASRTPTHPGSLQGEVFHDLNQNGIRDDNESSLQADLVLMPSEIGASANMPGGTRNSVMSVDSSGSFGAQRWPGLYRLELENVFSFSDEKRFVVSTHSRPFQMIEIKSGEISTIELGVYEGDPPVTMHLEKVERLSDGALKFLWVGPAGMPVVLQHSKDLTSWDNSDHEFDSAGQLLLQVSAQEQQQAEFFRLIILP
ncbi:choice-of-anchor D domain-containing protein [bacterium]|nr:choice-of-anchor D domain-containing protein [bacterium]